MKSRLLCLCCCFSSWRRARPVEKLRPPPDHRCWAIPLPPHPRPIASTGGGVTASGVVVTDQEAHIAFKLAGNVKLVSVAVGDQVQAGQALVQLGRYHPADPVATGQPGFAGTDFTLSHRGCPIGRYHGADRRYQCPGSPEQPTILEERRPDPGLLCRVCHCQSEFG